jgi:hypothetical protein
VLTQHCQKYVYEKVTRDDDQQKQLLFVWVGTRMRNNMAKIMTKEQQKKKITKKQMKTSRLKM